MGHALLANNDVLLRVGGGITIVMGLVMLGLFKPLQRDARLHLRPPGTLLGAPVLGASFGLGWVVCIGPTLTGVIALATATDWGGNAWRGLFLVLFYCLGLGLGLPFLLLAFGFSWATTGLAFLRRHARTIQIVGGVTLVALGLLMITGVWGAFIASLQAAVAGTPDCYEPHRIPPVGGSAHVAGRSITSAALPSEPIPVRRGAVARPCPPTDLPPNISRSRRDVRPGGGAMAVEQLAPRCHSGLGAHHRPAAGPVRRD